LPDYIIVCRDLAGQRQDRTHSNKKFVAAQQQSGEKIIRMGGSRPPTRTGVSNAVQECAHQYVRRMVGNTAVAMIERYRKAVFARRIFVKSFAMHGRQWPFIR
jgi:hypothetical protein